MERNSTGGGLVAEFLSLLQFAVDGGRGKAGFIGNLPYGLVLGMQVNEFLQVFGLGIDGGDGMAW